MPAPAVHLRFTSAADGDLAVGSVGVAARRRALVDAPWSWLRQVHGADVVTVRAPGEHAGATADAAVTAVRGAVLAVQVADCAPVALVSDGGTVPGVGVAHAGWRGLVAGVLPATVRALGAVAPGPVRAVLGPCIHPCCYEFGPADLDVVADAVGAAVGARTAEGALALDVPAAVAASLATVGVDLDTSASTCTACGAGHRSHRARREPERQAVVAWLA